MIIKSILQDLLNIPIDFMINDKPMIDLEMTSASTSGVISSSTSSSTSGVTSTQSATIQELTASNRGTSRDSLLEYILSDKEEFIVDNSFYKPTTTKSTSLLDILPDNELIIIISFLTVYIVVCSLAILIYTLRKKYTYRKVAAKEEIIPRRIIYHNQPDDV